MIDSLASGESSLRRTQVNETGHKRLKHVSVACGVLRMILLFSLAVPRVGLWTDNKPLFLLPCMVLE